MRQRSLADDDAAPAADDEYDDGARAVVAMLQRSVQPFGVGVRGDDDDGGEDDGSPDSSLRVEPSVGSSVAALIGLALGYTFLAW